MYKLWPWQNIGILIKYSVKGIERCIIKTEQFNNNNKKKIISQETKLIGQDTREQR